MLNKKTTTNDFNLPVPFWPFRRKGLADEYRTHRFLTDYGFIRLMSSWNGAGAGFGVSGIHRLGSHRRYVAAGRFCG